jgi:hypothetical protein
MRECVNPELNRTAIEQGEESHLVPDHAPKSVSQTRDMTGTTITLKKNERTFLKILPTAFRLQFLRIAASCPGLGDHGQSRACMIF